MSKEEFRVISSDVGNQRCLNISFSFCSRSFTVSYVVFYRMSRRVMQSPVHLALKLLTLPVSHTSEHQRPKTFDEVNPTVHHSQMVSCHWGKCTFQALYRMSVLGFLVRGILHSISEGISNKAARHHLKTKKQ